MYLVESGKVKESIINIVWPNLPSDKVNEAIRYEVWGTSFADTGDDYTAIKLFNEDSKVIHEAIQYGY
jgi:hypothetical protein